MYTLQRELARALNLQGAPWRVLSGHRANPGERPGVSADCVLVARSGAVELGAEFTYEPCHRRFDIAKGKFPVALWADVVMDTTRARQMVDRGAEVAYAILVDEGVDR